MKNKYKIYAFQKSNLLVALLSVVLLGITSCKKDPVERVPTKFDGGIFIVNEGAFGRNSGSVSYYNKSTQLLSADLFQQVNNFPLGDVVQSMSIYNEKAYIVVNNAKKIEVVSLEDFKSLASINGLNQPRQFLGINENTAYVSQWGSDGISGSIQVLDLNANTIKSNIPTAAGAEKMLLTNGKVYLTCNGGYGNANIVEVIDITTNNSVAKITVGDAPSYIQQDKNAKIWVLCQGKYKADYSGLETAGQLLQINPATNTIEKSFSFPINSRPKFLEINASKDQLYYSYLGNIYALSIDAANLNLNTALISRSRSFYGIGIDPTNNDLYGALAPNFTSNGWVYHYQNNGAIVDSFRSGGIGPNGFVFQ